MVYVDSERCSGCGICIAACPNDAIRLVDGVASVDQERCRQCEVCLDACPEGAILLVSEGEPVPVAQEITRVPSQPRAVQPVRPAAKILPWVGAALAFVGREVVPRLAVSLLDAWDRRARQPTAPSSNTADPPASRRPTTSGVHRAGRGRQHRLRRRGRS